MSWGKLVCPPSRFAHNPMIFASQPTKTATTMPPKKKKEEVEDLGAMKAARFGRVKNDLAMGFVGEFGLFLARTQSEQTLLLGGCALKTMQKDKGNALLPLLQTVA